MCGEEECKVVSTVEKIMGESDSEETSSLDSTREDVDAEFETVSDADATLASISCFFICFWCSLPLMCRIHCCSLEVDQPFLQISKIIFSLVVVVLFSIEIVAFPGEKADIAPGPPDFLNLFLFFLLFFFYNFRDLCVVFESILYTGCIISHYEIQRVTVAFL